MFHPASKPDLIRLAIELKKQILVLGAGMIGTCTALELQLRGHHVTLVDRRPPGEEASYGNAGLIQGEAVEPYAMPRDWRALLAIVLRRCIDVNYHAAGVLAARSQLAQYWRASAPPSRRVITHEYARLIRYATSEHARLLALAGAQDLLRRDGLRFVYRTQRALDDALQRARMLQREYGVVSVALDARGLAAAEPAFRMPLAGAVHWLDSWSINNPGVLVQRYARLFQEHGGRLVHGDADSLRNHGVLWQVQTSEGHVEAEQAVLATGAAAGDFSRRLGYRWPLFVKRGYHRHYVGGAELKVPALDAEFGYVLSPQQRGLRITSGAEIARHDARPTPRQLHGAEARARELLDIGRPVENQPWMGSRPCCADMKPLIGVAPRHPGLWINCGHGHHGFTLGPASARLLADLMEGGTPYIEPSAFSPARFRC
jgi:D-amino-acid dehydrogenase